MRGLEEVERGEVVVLRRHDQPVAEIRALPARPTSSPRAAGLLADQPNWTEDAFAPMSDEELALFDGLISPTHSS